MGTALVKLKIMPTSPEVDLEAIKDKAKEVVEKNEAKNISFEEEPIAFGLKAIILGFSIDESKELEPIEESLKKVENVNSVQVIDMRRAFG
jgi:elongation factor 1-beta